MEIIVRHIFMLASLTLLQGCLSTRPANEDDLALFRERVGKYEFCLGEVTQKSFRGSDDVKFLVEHSMSSCEQHLEDLYWFIANRGMTSAYAEGYVSSARTGGRSMVTEHILEEKSKTKK